MHPEAAAAGSLSAGALSAGGDVEDSAKQPAERVPTGRSVFAHPFGKEEKVRPLKSFSGGGQHILRGAALIYLESAVLFVLLAAENCWWVRLKSMSSIGRHALG